MPAAKRLDPTRSLRELIGWLIRLYRGEWIAERLAHKLSEALGRQVSVWMVSRWETGSEPLPAEAAVALDQVFQPAACSPTSRCKWCERKSESSRLRP